MARVIIPENPSELCTLAAKIKDKHLSLSAASPLKGMKWDEIGTVGHLLRAEFGEQALLASDVEHPTEKGCGGDEVEHIQAERPYQMMGR